MLPQKQLCTGCGGCAAACPKKCITMLPDEEGFRYPAIDSVKCVACVLCEKVCPILKTPQVSTETAAVAAKNVNDRVRLDSSSGGVFSALAEDVVLRGGCVCAARYNDEFAVEHALADSAEMIEQFRGAKYSQSRAEQQFYTIQEALQSGRLVLFVGTPCQVAGLQKFLRRSYDNLLLVDMICHGVPSPLVWERYWKARKDLDAPQAQLVSVNLRNKVSGWSRYGYSVEMVYDDKTIYRVNQGKDIFMQGFVRNLYLRPSCADCHFKGVERCSDLTLADYWGVWDQYPELDDNKGTSLLLIHSQKGQAAWSRVSAEFEAITVSMSDAIAQNPSAWISSVPHPQRAMFFKNVNANKSIIKTIQICLEGKQPTAFERILHKWRRK